VGARGISSYRLREKRRSGLIKATLSDPVAVA
jgi:hypothetical protein